MHENLCGKMQLAVLHLKGDGNSPFESTPKLTDDRRAREGSQDHVYSASGKSEIPCEKLRDDRQTCYSEMTGLQLMMINLIS